MDKLEEFLRHSNYIEREYSEQAFVDAKKAWNFAVHGKNEICLDYVLMIHRLLLKNLNPEIAGKIRDCAVYIGERICEKKSKKKLEREIENWITDCDNLKNEEDVKQAHINFEYMHPFRDGNGRVGRILMNIQRVNLGLPLLVIHEGWEQRDYYGWFKQADI